MEKKNKCVENIKEKENEIKKSLLQLEMAMKIDDPLKFRNQFEQDDSSKEIVEAYQNYSTIMKSILSEMTQFNWDPNSQQLTVYPETKELYKFLNKLDSGVSTKFEEEIGLIYIHDWKYKSISFINKNNPQNKVDYNIEPHKDTFLVVPHKFINELEIKEPLNLFTIKISKFAQKEEGINFEMLEFEWENFNRLLKKNPKALDSIYEDETSVIFVSNQTEYTFNDLSEFIKNKQSDKPYLEEFRNKFSKPQHRINPDITASNTKKKLEDLEGKIQEYDRCIKNLEEVCQKIDNFPFQKFEPPKNKNNKPTLDSNEDNKDNKAKKPNIKIDFTKADNSAFNMAAVNVDKENVIPTFSSIKADVPCILRGIQTTPICIPVYVFGNASKVKIEFHPTSQETPTPTYEIKDAQINLIFPINDIIQDMTFTGIMNINTKKIEYEVKANFIDSVVFLDSRGNKFINHRDGITFEKDFIAEDNINIIPEIPGEENPKQKILIENVKCQLPESPIQLKDNDKTIVFQKSSKNDLIDGITFHVYHTPLENSQVKINTPSNLYNRKIFFNSLYPPYKTISVKNELEIGYTYNKYCFLVSFFMKYREEPRITIKDCLNNVSLINKKITSSFDEHQGHIIIEVDIKSIASNQYEKSMLEISIDGQQFQWKKEIPLKIICPERGNPLKFGECNCYYNDISYSLYHKNRMLPHAYYDEKGYGTILTTNKIKSIPKIVKGTYQKELNDKCLLLFINNNLWIPASDPKFGKIAANIKEMPETNLKDLLTQLEEFFGKNAINIINSKIKNFVRKEDREQSIKEFIVKKMQEKFDKLKNDDFRLTYDDQFNINDVNSKRNIKFDLSEVNNQKAKNSEQLKQDILKFTSSDSTTIVTEIKADSLHKLTFDTRIISPDKRKVISERINSKLKEANEPILKLDMVPNDEEFDEEIISFGALTSAKAIYEKISEILSRCRKFVLIMSNYKDYTIGFPNSQAEIQFKNLAAFYAWSSNGSTLKTTPFLSQCIEFNNSFISLFKILNKSGCKIQNLKINEKDLKNSDLIQSIMKPKQPLLSVEQFKKDWVMVSRKPLNLNK